MIIILGLHRKDSKLYQNIFSSIYLFIYLFIFVCVFIYLSEKSKQNKCNHNRNFGLKFEFHPEDIYVFFQKLY